MSVKQNTQVPLRAVISFIVISLIFAFLPLLIAGRWDWWQGWAYGIVMLLNAVLSRLLMARRHPDLLAERGKAMQHADAKPWDRKLAPLVGFIGPFAILIVCGLEARFSGSAVFPLWANLLALLAMVLGIIFSSWALVENRFFSGMVRIQSERGHHVVDSGPYRVVRHPGYAGAMVVFLATPFLLNSLWGLLPAALTFAAIVLRTALEDQTLQAELTGYAEYARRTKYRLLPWVW